MHAQKCRCWNTASWLSRANFDNGSRSSTQSSAGDRYRSNDRWKKKYPPLI